MWQRLDETERDLYRQDAARFLSWMLTRSSCFDRPPSVALFMLARDVNYRSRILWDTDFQHTADDWIYRSQTTIIHLRTRCALLLNIHEDESKIPDHDTVSFIHRSAVEFLTDTEEGRQLLSCYPSTTEYRIHELTLAKMALQFLNYRWKGQHPSLSWLRSPLMPEQLISDVVIDLESSY